MKRLQLLFPVWKTTLAQYIVIFFSPIGWLVAGVGVMVAFDWIAGVAAAKKKGNKIVSGGFYRTFIKFTLYAIGIVATRMLEILMRDKIAIPFASLLAGFILLIEYKSVMENISIAIGVDLWDWIKDKIANIHPKRDK
jgi:hypothetical protein